MQWMVVNDDSDFVPASLGDCAKIKSKYGLTFPVLIDPDNLLANTMEVGSTNSWSYVFSQGVLLQEKKKYADQSAIEDLIEDLLGL